MGMVIDATLGLEGIRQKGNQMFRLGGPIQQFIDSTVLKGVEPYIPMRTGTATKSGILHSRIGYGMLKWATPYIRPIWFGWRFKKDGSRSKEFSYDRSRHPLAGKLWAEEYKKNNIQILSRMVRKKVGDMW